MSSEETPGVGAHIGCRQRLIRSNLSLNRRVPLQCQRKAQVRIDGAYVKHVRIDCG